MDPDYRGTALDLDPKDASLLEKAEEAILAYRRGDILLSVVDNQGQPIRDATVRYDQVRHSFGFGIHYPYNPQVYDLMQAAGLNRATLFLGWQYTEPEPGHFNWGYIDRVWDPCALAERGFELHAHGQLWFRRDWHVMPAYALQTPAADLPHLIYDHVAALVQRLSPYVRSWELITEPYWTETEALYLELGDMLRICHASALAVRDQLPDAQLAVDLAEISRTASYGIRPCDMVNQLTQASIPVDTVGLQQFENSYSTTTPPTFYRSKTLIGVQRAVRAYRTLGIPLSISALGVPSQPSATRPPSRFHPPFGDWDEILQARYLDAAMTLYYAEPEIKSITWWDAVDGRLAYVPGGGLLRADLSPKPAYVALRDWIARHTTSGQTRTDTHGQARLRGFAGDYSIKVGSGASGRCLEMPMRAGIVEQETVVLPTGQ